MKRFIYFLLIYVIFSLPAFATDTAEAIYAKAYAQIYRGNEKAAISTFAKGINYYPECSFLYAGMGDAYRKEGSLSKALEYYTQAQQKKYAIDNYKIDFYSTMLQKNMTDITQALNNLIAATKDFDNPVLFKNINLIMNERYMQTSFVTEMYLNTTDENLNKINALKTAGQTENAIKSYIALLNSNPKNFQAANNAGATLIEQKDYALAQKYLEMALSVNSNSAIIYNNLAVLNYYQGKYTDMENNFSKSLKINSAYFPALNNAQIAKIKSSVDYYKTENIGSIIDIMKKDFENQYAARTLAKIYYYKGDFKNANSILEPLNSNYNFRLYTQKAIVAFKAQEYSSALNYINKAINLYSENNSDYIIRGRIYNAIGRYADAKADFQKVISKTSNPDIYYYYARTLYKSGDLTGATSAMKNFISLKKGNSNSQNLKILFE